MNIEEKKQILKKHFLRHSYVRDAKKGYIVAEPFNLVLDPDILNLVSRCWAEIFSKSGVDAVVGLPDAGSRLVAVLADMLRVPVLPSKRIEVAPAAWSEVVTYSNSSFTTDKTEVISQIGFVKKGQRVLLIDDVIASGQTAVAAISALHAAGAEVIGLAVIFDKVWQGGVKTIQKETGVTPTSLISVTKIYEDGTLVV